MCLMRRQQTGQLYLVYEIRRKEIGADQQHGHICPGDCRLNVATQFLPVTSLVSSQRSIKPSRSNGLR